jgi:hypothetical protein
MIVGAFTVELHVNQALLTIATNGLSSSNPTLINIGGTEVGTAYDDSPYSQWLALDQITGSVETGTIEVTDIISAVGTQYVFRGWSDGTADNQHSSITMTEAATLTANYQTVSTLDHITVTVNPSTVAAPGTATGTATAYDINETAGMSAQPQPGVFLKAMTGVLGLTTSIHPIPLEPTQFKLHIAVKLLRQP